MYIGDYKITLFISMATSLYHNFKLVFLEMQDGTIFVGNHKLHRSHMYAYVCLLCV